MATKTAAKKKSAEKAVTTVADEIGCVWSGITTVDERQTVAELRHWIETEIGDLEAAVELLDELENEDAKLTDPMPD